MSHDCTPPTPSEPPIGSWVTDRYGAAFCRGAGGGWGPTAQGGHAVWAAMWRARGPLVPSGPYGERLPPVALTVAPANQHAAALPTGRCQSCHSPAQHVVKLGASPTEVRLCRRCGTELAYQLLAE